MAVVSSQQLRICSISIICFCLPKTQPADTIVNSFPTVSEAWGLGIYIYILSNLGRNLLREASDKSRQSSEEDGVVEHSKLHAKVSQEDTPDEAQEIQRWWWWWFHVCFGREFGGIQSAILTASVSSHVTTACIFPLLLEGTDRRLIPFGSTWEVCKS